MLFNCLIIYFCLQFGRILHWIASALITEDFSMRKHYLHSLLFPICLTPHSYLTWFSQVSVLALTHWAFHLEHPLLFQLPLFYLLILLSLMDLIAGKIAPLLIIFATIPMAWAHWLNQGFFHWSAALLMTLFLLLFSGFGQKLGLGDIWLIGFITFFFGYHYALSLLLIAALGCLCVLVGYRFCKGKLPSQPIFIPYLAFGCLVMELNWVQNLFLL